MMPNSNDWQKSSFSGGEDGDNCLELSHNPTVTVGLRESDLPAVTLAAKPLLVAGLIRHLKAGG